MNNLLRSGFRCGFIDGFVDTVEAFKVAFPDLRSYSLKNLMARYQFVNFVALTREPLLKGKAQYS
jgi:hypothetical protein